MSISQHHNIHDGDITYCGSGTSFCFPTSVITTKLDNIHSGELSEVVWYVYFRVKVT